MLQLIWLSTLL